MRNRESRESRVTVVMSSHMRTQLEELASENDRSLSDFIRLVCKDYIEALEDQGMEAEPATEG